MSSIGDRLRTARLSAGYKHASDAAEALGLHAQNVRDHEADRRGVAPDQALTYARGYSVEPTWLLYGGPNMKAKASPMVEIRGLVGANPDGMVMFADGQGTGDLAPLPPGGAHRAVALEVRGHSMPGLADDGALIYFEDQRTTPSPEMLGRPVIVELDTGEILLKRLLRGSAPGLYDLESFAGPNRQDVTIRWAANITAIIPPWQAKRIIVRSGETHAT